MPPRDTAGWLPTERLVNLHRRVVLGVQPGIPVRDVEKTIWPMTGSPYLPVEPSRF